MLFTLASLACACAWSLPSLLAARVLQGLGAGGIMSVNTALVRFVYPDRLMGQGFGHNAMVVATAFTLGPTIASAILAVGPWSWLFAVNIPFGLVAIVIGLKTLPRTPRATHAFDFPGALLAAACFGLAIAAIGSAAHHGAGFCRDRTGRGAAARLDLMRRQADHPAPMLPVDLFRRPLFALSVATAICSFAVAGPRLRLAAVLFRGHLGWTAVETGFLITPWPLVVAMMAPIAGRLSDRYAAGVLGGLGLAGARRSAWRCWRCCRQHPHIADIVWRMAICGCGFGFFQAPNMKALMSQRASRAQRQRQRHRGDGAADGQTSGAALAALCFGLAGRDGATVALVLGAAFAAVGCVIEQPAAAGGGEMTPRQPLRKRRRSR